MAEPAQPAPEPEPNAAEPARPSHLWPLWLGLALAIPTLTVTFMGCGRMKELDLATGRVRSTGYVAFIRVYQRVEDTALSKALKEEDLREAAPEWQPVSAAVLSERSAKYRQAPVEIGMIEIAWKCGKFTPEARRLMAKDVLALWREGAGVEASRPFMRKVEALIESAAGRELTAQDVLAAWRAAEAERARGAGR